MKTKCLLYCTKKTPTHSVIAKLCRTLHKTDFGCIGGKIVAECEVECEEIDGQTEWLCRSMNQMIVFGDICEKACIDEIACYKYLNGKNGYALHISNLKIFPYPLDLSIETIKPNGYKESLDKLYKSSDFCGKKLADFMKERKYNVTKAPQNMMWVEFVDRKYCLISIRPEWVAKILNGEKTIEVRKKVLKGMM